MLRLPFKLTLAALSLVWSASSALADVERTVETTALKTLLVESPTFDFSTPEAQDLIARRSAEITSVFDLVLTEGGKDAFLQSLPYVPGEAIVGFADTSGPIISALFAEGSESLDLTQIITGVATFDAAVSKYHATRLTKIFDDTYILHFPANINVNLVVADLQGAEALKYAESNGYFGGYSNVERSIVGDGRVVLYVLSLGMVDCDAGCFQQHRVYVELDTYSNLLIPKKVGESGDPIDQSAYPVPLFK